MKTRIGFTGLMLLLVMSGSMASAQSRPERPGINPGDRIERRIDYLDDRLDLTDTQEKDLRALLLERSKEMEQYMNEAKDLTREQRTERMRAFRNETDQAIQKLLTDEQKKEYSEIRSRLEKRMGPRVEGRKNGRFDQRSDRAERRGERSRRSPEERLDSRVNRLDERLNLSDEQESRIRELLTEQRDSMKEELQSLENSTREQRQALMGEHARKVDEAIIAQLNPEQAAAYKTLREQRNERIKDRLETRRSGR